MPSLCPALKLTAQLETANFPRNLTMNHSQLLRSITLCAALVLTANSSHAQPALDKTPIADKANVTDLAPDSHLAQIKVLNIPSALMAYWLDPTRQPKPIQIQLSEANGGIRPFERDPLPRQPGNGNGPRDLKLPPGVEIVVSVDPQNVLLVKGSKAGVEALRKLVKEIDVTIDQIEVEAQIWDMSPGKFASLPIVFRDVAFGSEKIPVLGDVNAAKNANITSGAGDFFARVAFAAPTSDMTSVRQKLNEGLADGSARLITAPRVTAIDGLVASLASTESRVLNFDKPPTPKAEDETTNNDDGNAPNPTREVIDSWKAGLTLVESQTGFAVAPVLHGDVMNLGFRITFDNTVTPGSTVMRDGQTLAVRLPNDNPATGWPRVALLKVHVIRRAGEAN